MKISDHCSGRAERVNSASSGLPTEVVPLPSTTVTRMVLSDTLDLMPKVAGLVMASEEVKALNCESLLSSSSSFCKTGERAVATLSQSGTEEDFMVLSC